MRLRALFVLIFLAVLIPVEASAQRCVAPQVLLTLDRSSSMNGVLASGSTKWEAASRALSEVVTAYAGNIDFGLQIFPFPDRCEPGAITLDVGGNPAETIIAAIGDAPPTSGNYTPMAQTLDVAAEYAPLQDMTRQNHLILITDGWQWCDPYDASSRFTPVESVQRLREAGITVHVVGFGGSVDPLTLNRAAVAAGTALPGCDATLTDASAENHCYLQAHDLSELRLALDDVARLITGEQCDGFDNDCDGLVDEGFDRDGDTFTSCGSNPTTPGVAPVDTRIDCNDLEARMYPGAEEVCDGLDNDCDGVTDPGCECIAGASRACGTDIGVCAPGTQRCVDGLWNVCEDSVGPVAEICDGLDNDCDGIPDNDADASCGEGMVCTPEGCIDLMPEEDLTVPPMEPATDLPEDVDPMMEGGCACSTINDGHDTPAAPWLAGLLMGVLAFRRRRAD